MKIKSKKPLLINITGTCGKTITAKIIEIVLTKSGYRVGLASTIGIYFKGRRVKKKDRSGPKSFQYLFQRSKELDVVICENVLRHIRHDTYYPALSDVCLITNVSDDHIHQTKTKTVREIAQIKSKILKRSKKNGFIILNGDNKYTLNIAQANTDKKLILFTTKPKKVKLLKKIKPLAIYLYKKPQILKVSNYKMEQVVKDVSKLPLTLNLKLTFNIYNLLAAISVLDNLPGISLYYNQLQKTLAKIVPSYSSIPGRFNIFDFGKFTVILDNAKNPLSYKKSLTAAKSIPHKRLITVLKASNTRTSQFIKKIGQIAARHSDFIYIKESRQPKGRKRKRIKGETAALLKEGALKEVSKPNKLKVILDEEQAVKNAILKAKAGDLLLVFGYRVDALHKLIKSMQKNELHSLKASPNYI
ncbi:hypothetical protein JW766_05200 [Candidatus Dojkabacteria bacterium]|nr:hypothetical protein [Candidatus Dojkabacteria bacterium]